jgi:high affinity Mn2+ porin
MAKLFALAARSLKFILPAYILPKTLNGAKRKIPLQDDNNQLAGLKSKRYFSVTAGKFGMADFYDGNEFSHDPRTQFMNWALMDNGAWDYPANTRGYAMGIHTELGMPNWTLRFAFTMSTTTANGAIWDAKVGKANTQTIEYERRYTINGNKGTVRYFGIP